MNLGYEFSSERIFSINNNNFLKFVVFPFDIYRIIAGILSCLRTERLTFPACILGTANTVDNGDMSYIRYSTTLR